MEYSTVVWCMLPKLLPILLQRRGSELPGDVHRYSPRERNHELIGAHLKVLTPGLTQVELLRRYRRAES